MKAANVGQHYDRWRYEQLGRPVQPAGVYELATVSSVVDGDIIEVTFPDGRTARVRLIGVDPPEIHGQVECYGEAASAFTRSLLLGKEVWLGKDVSEPDRYKRLLCYVWVGPYLFNEILVRRGYAGVTTYPPDVKYEWRRAGGSRGAGWSLVGLSHATGGWQAGTAPLHGRLCLRRHRPPPSPSPSPQLNCDPSYPTVRIPQPPPDLDFSDVTYRRFEVRLPDPHCFDPDHDGIGCELG